MQKERFQRLCGFGAAARRMGAELLSSVYSIRITSEDVKLPSKPGCASVALEARFGVRPDADHIRNSPDWNKTCLDGIAVFSGVQAENGCAILELSDELLKEYAKFCRCCLPEGKTGELIAIPNDGTSADEEAASYAAALLLGRGKTGKQYIPCAEARDALLRCLLLAEPQIKSKPRSALASAVRAALQACEHGSVGGEEALAMAAMLDYAANRID